MEAVYKQEAFFLYLLTPKLRVSKSPQSSLRQRISTTTSLKPNPLQGFSISSNGFQKFHGVLSNSKGFGQNLRNFPICRAEAAAAADGQSSFGEVESPKFLGIDLITYKKIIPLGLMFFCILFNYTILRDTKDVLVVTAKGSSAEIIPFLKTWVNLPMAIGFMVLYTKLADVLPRKALFYSVIVPFIAFFGAFGFVLYPMSDYFHPTVLADKLLATLGPRFLGPLAILRIWSFCLFYVMAELWGSVVISVLFWGFANQITTIDEAKRFYPLFGLGANVALIFSGRTVKYFSQLRQNLGPGVDGWAVSLKE
ncbi:Plastidic ATP/ADP-transporter [Bienertia sinuspersici]